MSYHLGENPPVTWHPESKTWVAESQYICGHLRRVHFTELALENITPTVFQAMTKDSLTCCPTCLAAGVTAKKAG